MTPKARHSLASVSAIAVLSVTAVSLPAQDITAKDLLDGLTNPSRWLTHSGDYAGHRFSPLTQITPANVGQLAAQWTFQTGVANKFEGDADRHRRHAVEWRCTRRRPPTRSKDVSTS